MRIWWRSWQFCWSIFSRNSTPPHRHLRGICFQWRYRSRFVSVVWLKIGVLDHYWDEFGVVRQVGIHYDHEFPPACTKTVAIRTSQTQFTLPLNDSLVMQAHTMSKDLKCVESFRAIGLDWSVLLSSTMTIWKCRELDGLGITIFVRFIIGGRGRLVDFVISCRWGELSNRLSLINKYKLFNLQRP